MIFRRRSRGGKDFALGTICLLIAMTSTIICLQTLNGPPYMRAVSLADKARYQSYMQMNPLETYEEIKMFVTHPIKLVDTGTFMNSSIVSQTKTAIRANGMRNFTIPKFTVPNKSNCDNKTEILVYIQSKWDNFVKRRQLRSTWASRSTIKSSWNVKIVFVLGRTTDINDQVKINNERLIHGDILEGDFIDSYQNLTLKSVTAMAFVDQWCKHVKYVIKIDDDMFLNLFVIMDQVLPAINSREQVIACHVIPSGKSPIVRDKNSKWYIPPSVFVNRTHLPQFCSGYMVIMTSRLIRDLFSIAKVTALINVDDVYMFGHLTQYLSKINFIDIKPNLTLTQDKGLESYRKGKSDLIAINVKDSSSMEELWSLTLMKHLRTD